jgi:hypothetical protein
VAHRKRLLACLGIAAMLSLAGCQVPGLTAAAGSSSTITSTPGSPGPTGFVYIAGSVQPSATQPVAAGGATVPSPALTLTLTLPPLPPPSPWVIRTVVPAAPCAGRIQQGKMDGLAVTPGTGTATVTWNNAGDPAVVSYRVAAVSQNLTGGTQAPVPWKTVAPAKGCGPLSTTVTGLAPGWYVFWLDAVVTSAGRPGSQDVMVGESAAVKIL